MRLPPIAPLTRREAVAARMLLEQTAPHRDVLTADRASFMDAFTVALEDAIGEYDSRGRLARLIPQPAGHRTRLRDWLEEIHGAVGQLRGGECS